MSYPEEPDPAPQPSQDVEPDRASVPRGELHIPGAGATGMLILLVSLSILFLASMAAFLIIRSHAKQWPPAGMPPLPESLWISTLIIVISSITMQIAFSSIRRDDERHLVLFLRITFGLGLLFLILQTINWLEFYHALRGRAPIEGAYLGMFYVLTGLHAAHVLGGLIPLSIVTRFAAQGRYSRNFHPGVRYSCAYWHFLDIVWVVLFCVLYF